VDLNGGNVCRTAIALGIPARTLADWVKGDSRRQTEHAAYFADGRKEKRGDLVAKMESVIHSAVESLTGKLDKASFSQTSVGIGILVDKARILRQQDPVDPRRELCQLLGINENQLPERLELNPGDEIPAMSLNDDLRPMFLNDDRQLVYETELVPNPEELEPTTDANSERGLLNSPQGDEDDSVM
jgi:hypothetical protein